ncbi:MAG: YveK family protein, partial [Actinomycetota bacterium]
MEFDLRSYVRLLLKRKWWVVGGLTVTLALGVLVTVGTTPVYQAQTSLFVGQRQISTAQLPLGLAVTNISDDLVRSYAQIIHSRTIAQRAISESGLEQTPGEIVRGLRAEHVVDTQVIRVIYNASDPAVAERVANAVARAFESEIDQLETSPQPNAQPAIQVSIIDPAVASSRPISPNPARNLALAVVLGVLVGGGLAFLVDNLDHSVKSREELDRLGLPALGVIPALDTEGEEIHLERDTQGVGGEAFRKLRTSIGFLGVE